MVSFAPDSALVTSTALSPNRTVTNGRYARLVVLHTMETDEHSSVAENIGNGWFTNPSAGASAHYNVDNDSIVQGVPEKDMAWAAPGANEDGIQIEQAGRASQTTDQWLDPYSVALLRNSAALVADICARNGIPPRKLTDAQLAAGWAGVVDHGQVSRVYRRSDHWDVGPGFPWGTFMDMVSSYTNGGSPATIEKDWFDMATRADLEDVVFNTRRPEWGNRTLSEMVREVDQNSWASLRMVRHLFNLYRLGIPGVVTDGTFGGKIRQIFGYDEGKQAKSRREEYDSNSKSMFRW